MSDHPVEAHPKRSPIWFYILLLIAVLGTVFGFSGKFFDRNMQAVVNGQLEKLRENRVTQAYYDYTSQEFQNTTSLEAFREFISLYPVLSDNKTFIYEGQELEGNSGRVKGVLVSKQMHEMNVDFLLVRENKQWKILSIRLKEALRGDKLDSVLNALTQKAEEQLKTLRKENIIDAYYGYVSKDFQTETPIQVFKDFVVSNPILTNYTGLKVKDSRIENDKGIVELILNSQAGEFLLQYKMIQEGDDWKIWSLKVVLSAEEAAKKAATNPESLISPVRELLDALLLKNIEQAYAGTAKEFQEATSLSSFQLFVESNPVFTNRDLADYKKGAIENGLGKLRVNLHDQDGMTVIEFKLGFENDRWEIWSMQVVDRPAKNNEQTAIQRQTTVGNQYLVENIRNVIQEHLENLKHQDYEAAYYNLTSQFYRNKYSLDRFHYFLSRNPVFKQVRSSSFERMAKGKNKVVMVGTITTFSYKTYPVKYELVKENHAWKIQTFGLIKDDDIAMADVDITPPEFVEKDTQIKKIVIGNRIDSEGIIYSPMVVIDPDEPMIYMNVAIESGIAGSSVALHLIHVDSDTKAPVQTVDLVEEGDSVVSFTYAAPENGWPEGMYVIRAVTTTGQEAIQQFQMRQDEKARY